MIDDFLDETETLNYGGLTDRFDYESTDLPGLVAHLTRGLEAIWHVAIDDETKRLLEEAGLSPDEYEALGRAMGATPRNTPGEIADAEKKERGSLGELLFTDVVQCFHHSNVIIAPNVDHPVSILKSEPGRDIVAFIPQDDECARCSGSDRIMVVSIKTRKGRITASVIKEADEELTDENFPLRVRQQLNFLLEEADPELRDRIKAAMARVLAHEDHASVLLAIATLTDDTPEASVMTAVEHLQRPGLRIARVLTCCLSDFEPTARDLFQAFRAGP